MRKSKVLVLHALHSGMRNTTYDFAGAFGRHLRGCDVDYLNIFGIKASGEIDGHYDLAILTTELLGLRSAPCWLDIEKRVIRLTSKISKVVMFPQDDYTFSFRLDRLAVSIHAIQIWTPITRDLPKLYPKSMKKGIDIRNALTGYIEHGFREKYATFSLPFVERTVDVGQRVRFLPAQFGKMGNRKARLASEFAQKARENGFRVDVSTEDKDALYGNDWLKFLGSVRFTISRKGGASLADTRNTMALSLMFISGLLPKLKPKVRDFLACRLGVKAGRFCAESPRLFEAAALDVCQILEVDDYLSGALQPWVHYIPITSDFSNLNEVFAIMRNPEKCSEIIRSAKAELIESGKYSYETFIAQFQREVGLEGREAPSKVADLDLGRFHQIQLLKDVVDYYQAGPSERTRFEARARNLEQYYSELTRFESVPETFIQPWIPASTKLIF